MMGDNRTRSCDSRDGAPCLARTSSARCSSPTGRSAGSGPVGRLARETPADRGRLLDPELARERRGERSNWRLRCPTFPARSTSARTSRPPIGDHEVDAARKNGVSDAQGQVGELRASRVVSPTREPPKSYGRALPLRGATGGRPVATWVCAVGRATSTTKSTARSARPPARPGAGGRLSSSTRLALEQAAERLRTSESNSVGSTPSAFANWRRWTKRNAHSSRRSGCSGASARARRSRSQMFHWRGT